jgi:hypothetical protein
VEQVAEFAEPGTVALVYRKGEEELKLVKTLFQHLIEALARELAVAGVVVAFAEKLVAGLVELAELAGPAVGVGIPLDKLAVENSMAMAAHNLVEGWAGTFEDSLEDIAESQVGVTGDSSEQILAGFPFGVVARNFGDNPLVSQTYNLQVDW